MSPDEVLHKTLSIQGSILEKLYKRVVLAKNVIQVGNFFKKSWHHMSRKNRSGAPRLMKQLISPLH